MYQHGTIFSLNNRMLIFMVWTLEIHKLIQLLKYNWFYNVCILIVKSFIHTKICGTSFQKGEHVFRSKFTYTIGSTLKIR